MTSPVVTVEIDFPGTGTWSDVTGYVGNLGRINITRGRQDQHATVQASTCQLTLDNPDGRFSAGNAGSPYYPNVRLQRPIRVRAAWVPGKNYLVNPTFEAGIDSWLWPNNNTSPGSGVNAIWSTTRAQQGTHSLELRNTTGSARDVSIVHEFGSLVIGATYTVSLWIYQTAGSTKVGIVGIGFSATTAVTGAFTQLTYTFTATQRYHTLIVTAVSLATSSSIWVDTAQVEDGGSATTFDGATPATWWGRFTGRTGSAWPLQWSGDPGLWAEAQLSCVDVFARLGRYKCRSTLAEQTKFSLTPQAYWALADANGSGSALQIGSDATIGPLNIDQIGTSPTGQVAFSSGAGPAYGDGQVLAFKDNSGNASNHYYLSCLNVPKPIDGTAGFTAMFWFANTTTPSATSEMILAAAYGVAGDWLRIKITSTAHLIAERLTSSGTVVYQIDLGSNGAFINGTVNHVALVEAWNGLSFDVTFYFNYHALSATTAAATTIPFKAKSFFIGSHQGGLGSRDGYTGSISNVVFCSGASDTAVSNIYQAGIGGAVYGQANQTNWTALLDLMDITIPRAKFATDSASGYQLAGQTLLSAIQALGAVSQTPVFVDPNGFVLQYRRLDYWNNTGVGLREFDAGQYSAPAPTLDDSLLVNDATITRPNGAGGYAHNETSKDAYGVYDVSQQIPTFLPQGAIDIANSLVNTYSEPAIRVPQVTIDVLTQWAALGPKVLTADVAYNLCLKNLPAQSPLPNLDLLIEGYTETISIDAWTVTFNTSLASTWRTWQLDVSPYSQLDSINRIAW
jgi:hypothetical protein